MSTTNQNPPTRGTCPECQTDIASFDVLIEYEISNGRQKSGPSVPPTVNLYT